MEGLSLFIKVSGKALPIKWNGQQQIEKVNNLAGV
jgi:hypothetical protein